MPRLEGDEKIKLEPEETIAERVKLNPWKRKNEGTGLTVNSKQIINQIPNISTSKSSKQFKQIKNWNKTNTISFKWLQLYSNPKPLSS